MKKARTSSPAVEAEPMPETDFSKGVRGKYYARAMAGRVRVHLDPDVAAAFPDDKSVNEALRTLLRIRQRETVDR